MIQGKYSANIQKKFEILNFPPTFNKLINHQPTPNHFHLNSTQTSQQICSFQFTCPNGHDFCTLVNGGMIVSVSIHMPTWGMT